MIYGVGINNGGFDYKVVILDIFFFRLFSD